MALPASGAISLQMIRNEFGGTGPIRLSDYYRGGGRVPNTAANANVPTSGAISLANFYGARKGPNISVTVTGGELFLNEPAPADAIVPATLIATATDSAGVVSWEWRASPGGPVITTFNELDVSAAVFKNSTTTLTWYLSWVDGASSGSVTVPVTFRYQAA